jgi:hypothetical protein
MKHGDFVRLTIPGRGGAIGRIEATGRPEDIPIIHPFTRQGVQAILNVGADLIALASYSYGVQQLMVLLIRTPEGWRTIAGQTITVEPVRVS